MSNPYRLKEMHVADLFELVAGGDPLATHELIERQQRGESLRYYPFGRQSIDDEGVVPVSIMPSNEAAAQILSGQPHKPIYASKDTVFDWIVHIPQIVARSVQWRSEGGFDKDEVEFLIKERSDPDFEAHVIIDDDEEESLQIEFLPSGKSKWMLSIYDCARLVKNLVLASEEMGWKCEWGADIPNTELALIHALINRASDPP